MPAPFRVVSPGENPRWPSGQSQEIAVIAISPDDLAHRVGVALATGLEEGLGPWQGVGLELRSGAPVEIIRYDKQREPCTFYIRADGAAEFDRVWSEIPDALGIEQSAIVWVLPGT